MEEYSLQIMLSITNKQFHHVVSIKNCCSSNAIHLSLVVEFLRGIFALADCCGLDWREIGNPKLDWTGYFDGFRLNVKNWGLNWCFWLDETWSVEGAHWFCFLGSTSRSLSWVSLRQSPLTLQSYCTHKISETSLISWWQLVNCGDHLQHS